MYECNQHVLVYATCVCEWGCVHRLWTFVCVGTKWLQSLCLTCLKCRIYRNVTLKYDGVMLNVFFQRSNIKWDRMMEGCISGLNTKSTGFKLSLLDSCHRTALLLTRETAIHPFWLPNSQFFFYSLQQPLRPVCLVACSLQFNNIPAHSLFYCWPITARGRWFASSIHHHELALMRVPNTCVIKLPLQREHSCSRKFANSVV